LLFGARTFYAVPLAAIIGLPLYITTDSGIPIIQSMLQSGASEGAMLAFMIAGSATSAWVIAGLSTFLKKRAILLYVGFVMTGGILTGYLLDFINLVINL
ncbi:MAG: permease, partial [Pseudomonadota bacterium]